MRECIIYGAGKFGKTAYEEYKTRVDILFFVDADEKKWNQKFCNLLVRSPDVIKDETKILVLIAIKFGAQDVFRKLQEMRVANIRIYYPGMSLLEDSILEKVKRLKPGILVDSMLIHTNHRPIGPERFVHKIEQELTKIRKDILFVKSIGNSLVTNNEIYTKYFKYFPETKLTHGEKMLEFQKGDKLLFLAPNISHSFYDAIDYIANQDIELYTVIYDLYSFNKNHNVSDYVKNGWIHLFYKVLGVATGVLCYSRAVIHDLKIFYPKGNIQRKCPLNVYLFPLGADIVAKGKRSIARTEIMKFMDCNVLFLMVGSLQHHKGYDIVLEVFKRTDFHDDVRLLILGQHISSLEESLKQRILEAEKESENILWIDDATDEEVCYCYQHATALIAASRYEGYGLPLVEAAQYGLPIICSDIPVFREVTAGHATFFDVGDSDSLAETLKKWLEESEHPDSGKIPIHTWRESADAILDIVEGRTAPYVTLH